MFSTISNTGLTSRAFQFQDRADSTGPVSTPRPMPVVACAAAISAVSTERVSPVEDRSASSRCRASHPSNVIPEIAMPSDPACRSRPVTGPPHTHVFPYSM
jgi:hypothetical protein